MTRSKFIAESRQELVDKILGLCSMYQKDLLHLERRYKEILARKTEVKLPGKPLKRAIFLDLEKHRKKHQREALFLIQNPVEVKYAIRQSTLIELVDLIDELEDFILYYSFTEIRTWCDNFEHRIVHRYDYRSPFGIDPDARRVRNEPVYTRKPRD